MDLVMATSRGKGLSEEFDLLPENPLINPIFSIHPGRSLSFLTDKAIEIITNSPYPTHTIHVYFIAGLIDLSEKITDIHYKEFICNDSYIDSYHNMQNILDNTQTRILNIGATPCFATITPMHIDTWNHHCLHANLTSYLLHYKHYDSMQGNHTEATVLTNQYLTVLNSQLNMNTPRLSQYILYKPGTTRQTYRFRHHLLPDGVHPNSDIKQKWAETLQDTISINRIKHS